MTPRPTLDRVGRMGVIVALASLGLASACEADRDSTLDPAPRTPSAALEVAGVETRLFAIEGLEGPAAVKYDAAQDVYFISNSGPSDAADANDGYLSRVPAEDGAVAELRWAVGDVDRPLLEPRGMTLAGDTLWVADARGLHAFDPVTGTQLDFVDLGDLEPGVLSDVAAGPDGGLYVTDPGGSRLIRRVGRTGIVVATGASLGSPSGIVTDPVSGRLILLPWEGGGDSLRVWDPVHRTLETWARSPGGPFHGAEFLGPDLVVASQGDSTLRIFRGGIGQIFQRVAGRPADIAIDSRRGRIAVPYTALDRVDVFPGVPRG